MTQQRIRPRLLPNLTSVRIFAAVYVLFYHFWGDSPLTSQAHWYDAWRNGGYLGVSLFFVLSGFILAYNAPQKIKFRRFYALRFARVYPLYLAALLWALPNYLAPRIAASRRHPAMVCTSGGAAAGADLVWASHCRRDQLSGLDALR